MDITPQMVRELRDAFGAASAREEIRVIVLAGRGAVFCAGADVEWMRRTGALSEAENQKRFFSKRSITGSFTMPPFSSANST